MRVTLSIGSYPLLLVLLLPLAYQVLLIFSLVLDVIVDGASCSSCNMLAFFFIAPLDDGYGDPGWDHWLKRIRQSIIDEAGSSFSTDSYIDGSFTTYEYNATYTADSSQFFLEHLIVYQQGTGILRNYTYTKNEVGQPISDSIFITRTHLSAPGFEVIPIVIGLVFLALIPLLWRRRELPPPRLEDAS
jgi:hypothetical protein